MLYEDDTKLVSIINTNPKALNTKIQIAEIVLNPLVNLCSHLIAKLAKPIPVPHLQPQRIDIKAHMHCNYTDIQGSITNLLIDILRLQQQNIKQVIPLADNPYIAEYYYLFIESRHITEGASAQAMVRAVKNYGSHQHSYLYQLSTIICLDSSLMFVLAPHLDINEGIVSKLNSVYRSWKHQQSIISTSISQCSHSVRMFEGLHIMHNIIGHGKIKPIFYLVKNCTIKIRYMPNLITNYIRRQDKKSINYAFSLIKHTNRHNPKHTHSYSQLYKSIKTIINVIHKLPSVRQFYNNMQYHKSR